MLSSFINSITTNYIVFHRYEYECDKRLLLNVIWMSRLDWFMLTYDSCNFPAKASRVSHSHVNIDRQSDLSRVVIAAKSSASVLMSAWLSKIQQWSTLSSSLIVRTRTPSVSIVSLLLQTINFNDSGCIVQNESVCGQLKFLPIHVNKKQSTFPGPQSVHILKRNPKIEGAAKVSVQL